MTKDNKINKQTMTEDELNQLSIKIVSRMMNIQTMSEWYEHVSSSDIAIEVMDKKLSLNEEENAVGELAKYMTLMELFKDKEEYEKCAVINKIINHRKETVELLRAIFKSYDLDDE